MQGSRKLQKVAKRENQRMAVEGLGQGHWSHERREGPSESMGLSTTVVVAGGGTSKKLTQLSFCCVLGAPCLPLVRLQLMHSVS